MLSITNKETRIANEDTKSGDKTIEKLNAENIDFDLHRGVFQVGSGHAKKDVCIITVTGGEPHLGKGMFSFEDSSVYFAALVESIPLWRKFCFEEGGASSTGKPQAGACVAGILWGSYI
ncbi:hypothetical protein B0H11DRAFT_1903859 [Mycena galericulata]|nr:hypothetical protein B0H11DRAFT_1903859 [Mycena galericulata]